MTEERKPQQKRSLRTRKKILAKARKIFSIYGFEATKLRDIARAAGTTHSMIRYHFGDKDTLWKAAVEEMFTTLAQSVQPTAEERTRSNVERLRIFVRRYIAYSAKYPEHAMITIQETISGGERLKWMVENFVLDGHVLLSSLLKGLIEEKQIPAADPMNLIYAIVSMAQMPYVLRYEAKLAFGIDVLSQEAIDQHAETVINLLLRD